MMIYFQGVTIYFHGMKINYYPRIHIHWLGTDMLVSCQREQYSSIEIRYLGKRGIYETPICLWLDSFVVDCLL